MTIKKSDLEKMNDLLAKGKKISELRGLFPQYEYGEIYWQVNDHSFLGKKRTITNRINSLVESSSQSDREKLAAEAKSLLNELYTQLKSNSSKLIEIDSILRVK